LASCDIGVSARRTGEPGRRPGGRRVPTGSLAVLACSNTCSIGSSTYPPLGQPEVAESSRATAFPADLLDALAAIDPAKLRPRAILDVHLSDLALAGLSTPGARVEGMSPLLADHHLFASCNISVKPVVDLNDRIDTNCYEHPAALREHRLLATPGDSFPYAAAIPGLAGPVDLDHCTPYDTDGPPGHTGMHGSAPLGRRHHRWKTHAGYVSRQCGTSRWARRTPYGLRSLVDRTGSHLLDDEHAQMLMNAPAGVDLYFCDLTYQP
jgi:hypothetical protein